MEPKDRLSKLLDPGNTTLNGIDFVEFYETMPTIWKFAIQSFIDEGKILIEP